MRAGDYGSSDRHHQKTTQYSPKVRARLPCGETQFTKRLQVEALYREVVRGCIPAY